jgi:integrase
MARPRKKPPRPARRQRGAGSISVSADGTIRARLPARVDPRRPAREFRAGQLAEAVAWLDARTAAPATMQAPAAMTLEVWAGLWHARYVAPVRPPNTAVWYLYALRQLGALYERPVADIRASELQAVVGALAGRLEPATVHAIVGVWRRCLDAAVDDGLISRNPARRLVVPKAPRRAPARHVTADEAATLRRAIVGERFEAAYALMLGCGLRMGEILGLHWQDVDLAGARAWIGPQYTNNHWRPAPKANNPHAIPLPPFVVAALVRHKQAQPTGAVLVMQSSYPHRGRRRRRNADQPDAPRPWSQQAIARDLTALLRRVGLDAASSHAFRHGLATFLMAARVEPAVIAERLGNTPAVVLNTYAHATDAGQQLADELVDRYLGGEPDPVAGTDQAG